ncbi:hypothetical protein DFQ30_003042, partial [Apophysomyces sp. BC1015]
TENDTKLKTKYKNNSQVNYVKNTRDVELPITDPLKNQLPHHHLENDFDKNKQKELQEILFIDTI